MLYLPEDLEQIIFSTDTFDFLRTLWEKFNLSEAEQATLGSEVGLYLSGMTKEKDFAPRLMYALNRDKNTANAIKDELDRAIVSKVKKSFDAVQNDEYKHKIEDKVEEESGAYGLEQGKREAEYESVAQDKESILKDIEDVADNKTHDPEGEEIDQKLDQLLSIPKGEVTETGAGIKTPKIKSPLCGSNQEIQIPKKTTPAKPIPQKYDSDPYREPTE